MTTDGPAGRRGATRAATAWTAFLAVIAFGHHLGSLLSPLGEVGDAQWADWIDLLLPYPVVATAGTALLVGRAAQGQPGPLRLLLAVGVGVTLSTNAVGGHAVPLAVGASTALAVLAAGRRPATPESPLGPVGVVFDSGRARDPARPVLGRPSR